MRNLYSALVGTTSFLLPALGLFSKKMQLFVQGRRDVITALRENLNTSRPLIWFHAASLGEYEQGLPVMEAVAEKYPEHQLLLTFFSPSGYEVKKDTAFAKAKLSKAEGIVTYLPLDTPSKVCEFLDVATPEMVFFIKYEFWPNYLHELRRRKIRTFLISGVFREHQPFFKPLGKWMTPYLEAFEHFFLQDASSAKALEQLGFQNFRVSGDTRFDRVSHQIEMDNTLKFATEFVQNNLCVVCGSTWPEDDTIICQFVNNHKGAAKFIVAPHEINPDKVEALRKRLQVNVVLYSEREGKNISDYDVLIIDTIGLLTKIYSYASIAYVGGAMGTTGLHNILEPATFGVPLIIGPNFDKFPEAKRLQQLAGLYTASNYEQFKTILNKLLLNEKFRTQTGMIAGHFVNSNTGATNAVMEYLAKKP